MSVLLVFFGGGLSPPGVLFGRFDDLRAVLVDLVGNCPTALVEEFLNGVCVVCHCIPLLSGSCLSLVYILILCHIGVFVNTFFANLSYFFKKIEIPPPFCYD